MNNTATKVLATVAMILMALSLLATVIVLLNQNTLVMHFYRVPSVNRILVPSEFVVRAAEAVIILIFFILTLGKADENKRIIAILLVIASIVIGVLSFPASSFVTMLYAKQGSQILAQYASVNSMVAIASLAAGPALPLFYIACGRYIINPDNIGK